MANSLKRIICPQSALAPFANSAGHQMSRKRYAEPDTMRCYRCHLTVAPSIFGDGPCRTCGQPLKPVWGHYLECECGWPSRA